MTTNTKPVRTVTLGWEEYILPASMTDKQVIELVGTLAMLDKVTSKGTKDYKVSHHYVSNKQNVMIQTRNVHANEAAATAACDAYNEAAEAVAAYNHSIAEEILSS